MNVELLREYMLTKPHVTEDLPFGPDVLAFRIGKKIFGLIPLGEEPERINLKCDPARVPELREEHAFILPGFHQNKKHWNTLLMAKDANWKLVKELIDHSYDLVYNSLTKATKEFLKSSEFD
jgi:predicted DNA-binding protein (MmcQ/YjbR family)